MYLVMLTCHVKSLKVIQVMVYIFLFFLKISSILLGIVKIVGLNFTPNMC